MTNSKHRVGSERVVEFEVMKQCIYFPFINVINTMLTPTWSCSDFSVIPEFDGVLIS